MQEDDKTYRTIGELSRAVGVSPQTLRNWERRGLISPRRSAGGQRLYDAECCRRVRQVVGLRRQHGWNAAAMLSSGTLSAVRRNPDAGESSLGAKVRQIRRSRGLTLQALATDAELSESFLSSLERGESGASATSVARIADALNVPQSVFSSGPQPADRYVERAANRRGTSLAGGVRYEELAGLGHCMEPALIIAPAGSASGGFLSRRYETFVFVTEGWFEFSLRTGESTEESALLGPGDSIMLPPGTPWTWSNPTDAEAQAVHVEMIGAPSCSDPSR